MGKKAAIYTYHGVTLHVKGAPSVAYVAEETPMLSYANLHFALEKLRQISEDTRSRGPRVLILGSEDAGKTSLTKILTSYATRQGRKPIVVGLDPKQVRASYFPRLIIVDDTVTTRKSYSRMYRGNYGSRRRFWIK